MKGEKGQVLPLVLIIVAVGGVLLAPFLNYMSTGIKSTSLLGGIMEDQYSCDAGVEDALWRLHPEYGDLAGSITEGNPAIYSITVNDTVVNVTVGLAVESGRLRVRSSFVETATPNVFLFTIIVTNIGTSTIYLEGIGDLLPWGFTYVDGSCQDYADNIAVTKSGVPIEPAKTWNNGRQELAWTPVDSNHFPTPIPSGETRTQCFRAAAAAGHGSYNEAWVTAQPNSLSSITSADRYNVEAEVGVRAIRAYIGTDMGTPQILTWQVE